MRTLMLTAPGEVQWHDTAEPILQTDDDALVVPIAVALCDGDVAALQGRAPLPMPYPLGHEFVATVAAVGAAVTTVAVGDTVMVSFQICCGTCDVCRDGRTGNCTSVPRLSMYGFGAIGGSWGGALTELVRVPYADHMLLPLPVTVSPLAAANVADNLTDAWRLVVPALQQRPASDVLIVGGGAPSVGLWAAELAVLHGADHVIYIDDDDDRRSLASAAGATTAAPSDVKRYPECAITVDASGEPHALVQLLRSTAPDGVCLSAGIYWHDVALPLLELYSKNATFITGRPHSRAMFPAVLDLVATGSIDPLRVATIDDWNRIADHVSALPTKLILQRQPA